jgi:hypothetical protein
MIMGKYRSLGSLWDSLFRNNLNANFNDIDSDIKNVQAQVDTLVVNGDSSPAAAQAAVDANGVTKSSLKKRLDDDYNELSSSVAENTKVNGVSIEKFPLQIPELDDLARIQRAINAETTKVLLLPANTTYNTSSGTINLKDGIVIISTGNGMKPSINSGDKTTFSATGKQNIFISGLELISLTHIIELIDCANIEVEHCKIKGLSNSGANVANIRILRNSTISFTCENIKIHDNEIETYFLGVLAQGKSGLFLERINIYNNIVKSMGTNIAGSGEAIKYDYYVKYSSIYNNDILNAQLSGITVEEGCEDIFVTRNNITCAYQDSTIGIRLTKGQQIVTMLRITVSENTVKGGLKGISDEDNSMIKSRIYKNTTYGQKDHGIYVSGDFCEIEENTIYEITNRNGLYSRATNSIVKDNKLTNADIYTQTSNSTDFINNKLINGDIKIFRSNDVTVKDNRIKTTVSTGGLASILIYTSSGELRSNFKIIGNIVDDSTKPNNIQAEYDIDTVVIKDNVGVTDRIYVKNATNVTSDGNVQLFINVKDFGAKGDGVTDDTSAINRAYQDLKAKGKGKLYFPRGTFNVNLVIDSSNVQIEGAGRDVTVLKSNTLNSTILKTQGVNKDTNYIEQITIKDLTIEGDTGKTQKGLELINSRILNVVNVTIRNCKKSIYTDGLIAAFFESVFIRRSLDYAFHIFNSVNLVLKSILMDGTGKGSYTYGLFVDSKTDGIDIANANILGAVTGVTVKNTTGLTADLPKSIFFTSVQSGDCSNLGWNLESGVGIQLTNCWGNSNDGQGAMVKAGRVQINNSQFNYNGKDGMQVGGGEQIQLTACSFARNGFTTDNAWAGLDITNTKAVRVSSCSFGSMAYASEQDAETQKYGFTVRTGANDIKISNSIFGFNKTGNYVDTTGAAVIA